MGNVSGAASPKEGENDEYFMQLQMSALFNEPFVSSLFDKLPAYDTYNTEAKEVANVLEDSPNVAKLKRVMSILAPQIKGVLRVEDIEVTTE
jgi:hypothetical protein